MSYAVAAKALKRDIVLDAAGELMRTRAWADVTMSDVAGVAGVSRQTLYNEFGDRQGLAQAYVLREGERFMFGVAEAIVGHEGDPRGALAGAFETFLSAAADHPVIRAIASGPGGDELLELVTTQGAPVVEFATEGLSGVLVNGWPRLREADARRLADVVVRLGISHAALPAGSPRATAEALAAVLGPYLDALYVGSR